MPPFLDWYRNTIPPKWGVPDHVRLLAEHLDAVERGQIDRLAISMPPRHGKSETITVRYPLYCLEARPDENVLVTGYNERFARKFGRKTRNMASQRGYVADDKASADEWATTHGGLYMARGVGSPPTGTGFGRIVVDDPIRRREDAESQVYRDKAWDWYSEDLYSRLEPEGAIIMVGTRWHHDDIIARAIASEPGAWTVLNLPAIDDDGRALWPNRYDIKALERIRSVNPRAFESLYQGNPTPREGSFFLASKLEIVSAVPAGLNSCMGLDLGATNDDGDWTAAPIMHGPDADGFYYVEPARIRREPAERNRWIRQRADLKRPRTIRWPQDPGAAGKESAQAGVRLLAGHNVKTAPISGDKQLRAEPHAAQVNAGNVRVVCDGSDESRKAAEDYIEEHRQFPFGAHDDQVDASSDAFNELAAPIEVTFYFGD